MESGDMLTERTWISSQVLLILSPQDSRFCFRQAANKKPRDALRLADIRMLMIQTPNEIVIDSTSRKRVAAWLS